MIENNNGISENTTTRIVVPGPKRNSKIQGEHDVKEIHNRQSDTGNKEISNNKINGNITLYTIQIASLNNKEKADKLINTIKKIGYEAYYVEANIENRTYYRIRCGRFYERNEALIHVKELEQKIGMKGFISRIEADNG